MKSMLLGQAHLKSATAHSSRAKEIITFIIFVVLNIGPRSKLLWLDSSILVMTLLISEVGLADERPRSVTLVIERNEVDRRADGVTSSNPQFKIYFASDGTAYVQFDLKHNVATVGVVLPPNVSSGSYSYDETVPSIGPMRITSTASIYGQMSSFNIMLTNNICSADRRGYCYHATRRFILHVSGTTCTVVGGTTTTKESPVPNPIISTSIVGPQTCSIRPGRQLGG
jgi:hypothetical protein